MCQRWQTFAYFRADLGPRPDGHTIDRPDGDCGYWCGRPDCPDCGPAGRQRNGRWAPRAENAGRTRRTVLVELPGGVLVPLAGLARAAGVRPATALRRWRKGLPLWRCLRPVRPKGDG